MSGLFEQFKRRNVFRAAATYAALSWVLLQVIDLTTPILGLPDSLMPLARPLMWANLKYNALWTPALENKNVRAWYDEFEVKMVQAREEIQAFDDPAFGNRACCGQNLMNQTYRRDAFLNRIYVQIA